MPGIVGLISRKPAQECKAAVRTMIASMLHEPFCDCGHYFAEELGVYGGWINHKDSFAAQHMLVSRERDIALLFSGEVMTDGHDTRSESGSDTNALVRRYLENDGSFLDGLNGLFSGLLIDRTRKVAYLFNDRYGAERLYWYQDSRDTYFATEAKALLHVLPQLRSFDTDGVAQFLAFGCTLNWQSLFTGIQVLPGGSLWSFAGDSCNKRQYFSAKSLETLPALAEEEFESQFSGTFRRILPRYFECSDSLGIALTGGLDTRMIMACRPNPTGKLISYTFTGESGETRDDRIAAAVASVCAVDHQLLRLGPDFFSNFAAHADRTIYVTDGCFGVTGAHEIYFNERARELSSLRLTGLFGSEILRAISTFKPAGLPDALISADFAGLVTASARAFVAEEVHPVTYAAFRNVPWNLFGSMAASRSQVVLRTPYLDTELVALAYQAPANLRTSPHPAMRVITDNNPVLAKIPTDRRIEDKDSRFPRNMARLILETGFKLDYYRNEGMPHWAARFDRMIDLLNSRVRIFGNHKFLHYRRWFADRLAPYITDIVTDPRTRQMPFWNKDFLDRMVKAHTRGYGNYVGAINAVLTLEAVERLLLRDLPRQGQLDSATRLSAATTGSMR